MWKNLAVKRVQELRFLFCGTSPSSVGIRNFVKAQYPTIKAANPALPILVRESNNFEPVVVARFDFGKEIAIPVSGATEQSITEAINNMLAQQN